MRSVNLLAPGVAAASVDEHHREFNVRTVHSPGEIRQYDVRAATEGESEREREL